MAVALDAIGTLQPNTSNSLTSFNYNGITVGSGVNMALLLVLYFSTTSNPTGISCHWDSAGANQNMLAFGPQSGVGVRCRMYGLVNPTPGNKTLAVTWTNADNVGMNAISFSGVLQTSNSAAFLNYTSNTSPSSATTSSVTITASTPSDMILGHTNGNFAITPSGSNVAWNQTCFGAGSEQVELEYYVAGGASTTFNWGFAGSASGGSSGIDIVWDGTSGAAGQNAGIIGMGSAEW